ncbi:MFS transporter [Microbacterium sp. 179-I 3D2 NHS]|uniref:MFS transporter n=1 Tax=Microbacterium sp. 179-I 3D2 NHS TaxID=3235178 RepID=UPI0039A08551
MFRKSILSLSRTAPTTAGGTLAAVAMVQFLVSLDLSIVNVALPQIADTLGFGATDASWIIHAYALTFGGLLLLGGKIADRYGRRALVLVGLSIFAVASLGGTFVQDPLSLVVARGAQGMGAAALAPAALASLSTAFPTGSARVRAFAAWGAMNAAGGAFGVLLGGVLAEYAGWRWVMFVNVPMAVIAIVLAWRGIPAGTGERDRRGADVLGAVLVTLGMGSLVYGIVAVGDHPLTSPEASLPLIVAAALLTALVIVERTTRRDPVFPLRLVTERSIIGANLCNVLIGASMASAFYFVSLYLQRVLLHGPALTGVEFVPFSLGVILGSILAGRLGKRLRPLTLLIAGILTTALGFAWFGLSFSPDAGFLTSVLGPSVVSSIGFGVCLGPVVSIATAGVAQSEAGSASGLLNATRQIGASLGLAVLGTAAAVRSGGSADPQALSSGYAVGMLLSAVLLIAAAAIALLLIRSGRRSSSSRAAAAS